MVEFGSEYPEGWTPQTEDEPEILYEVDLTVIVPAFGYTDAAFRAVEALRVLGIEAHIACDEAALTVATGPPTP